MMKSSVFFVVSQQLVIAGLDPAIHPLRQDSFEEGWMPGSSPGMTTEYDERASRLLDAAILS
jgi:hypothetical protein